MDDDTTSDNISDLLSSNEYSSAQESLYIAPVPDIDDVWQFAPFMRPLDYVRSGNNSFTPSDAVLSSIKILVIWL